MEITERQLKMLVLENGKCPFEEWFENIKDVTASAKIEARLTRVEAGNLGVSKSVGKGVYELKIDYGPGYRVYFTEADRVIIVLLGGGDKKTQQGDFHHAQELWEKYKSDPQRFQRDFRA